MPAGDVRASRAARATNRSRAREMRHSPVSLEKLYWAQLRDRRLGGYKFRRQYLIDPYIADFVCTERKLVIELDGPLHEARKGYDARLDAYCASRATASSGSRIAIRAMQNSQRYFSR